MFFSKVVLFAISLGAISVLATPHALHHHALHRRAVTARAVAARVASSPSFISNPSNVTTKRQSSPKCIDRSSPDPSSSSSSSSSSIPAVTPNVQKTPVVPPVVPPVTPTPSPTPTPTPTHQQPAPPTTTSTTPPTTQPPSTGGGGGGGTFSGDGTFFDTGLGACGITNVNTDYIVAVSMLRFDEVSTGNSNTNPLCGKKVSITYKGAHAIATIVDRCVGCARDSIDMTPSLFSVFAPFAVGRIHGVTWSFV